jgi:hypothetical protein
MPDNSAAWEPPLLGQGFALSAGRAPTPDSPAAWEPPLQVQGTRFQ